MKSARLPNGEMAMFDDDVPDEHMDAAIQHRLNGDVQTQMGQQRNGLMEVGVQTLSAIAELLAQQGQMLAEIAAQLNVLNASMGANTDKLHAALTAPKKYEIERGKDGKPSTIGSVEQ